MREEGWENKARGRVGAPRQKIFQRAIDLKHISIGKRCSKKRCYLAVRARIKKTRPPKRIVADPLRPMISAKQKFKKVPPHFKPSRATLHCIDGRRAPTVELP